MSIELVFVVILIFSVIIHEVSHGLMADHLGDPTPRLAGRLTFNPLPHIDPIGSILVPLILIISKTGFVFGWAKPVPINPYNLRDQKYGMLKVGIAGISANILLAVIFGLPIRFLPITGFFGNLKIIFALIVWVNLLLAIFNLFPFPPFDGHHIFSTFFPILGKLKSDMQTQIISMMGAVFFLMFIGKYIIFFVFKLITGVSFTSLAL